MSEGRPSVGKNDKDTVTLLEFHADTAEVQETSREKLEASKMTSKTTCPMKFRCVVHVSSCATGRDILNRGVTEQNIQNTSTRLLQGRNVRLSSGRHWTGHILLKTTPTKNDKGML